MKWTRKVSPCLDHRSSGGPQLTRKSPSQRTCFLQDTQRARRLAEPSLWLQPSCGRWSASKALAAWQSKRGQGLGPLCENSMRSSGTNTTVLLDFTTEMAGPTSGRTSISMISIAAAIASFKIKRQVRTRNEKKLLPAVRSEQMALVESFPRATPGEATRPSGPRNGSSATPPAGRRRLAPWVSECSQGRRRQCGGMCASVGACLCQATESSCQSRSTRVCKAAPGVEALGLMHPRFRRLPHSFGHRQSGDGCPKVLLQLVFAHHMIFRVWSAG